MRARWVRYEPIGVAAPSLAIGDIRVFGTGSGRPPASPRGVSARRAADRRDATAWWRAVPGAVGYNVLWVIAREKLYRRYQVWADAPGTMSHDHRGGS